MCQPHICFTRFANQPATPNTLRRYETELLMPIYTPRTRRSFPNHLSSSVPEQLARTLYSVMPKSEQEYAAPAGRSRRMMRLSDVFTIYCAVGASFAAARFAQNDDTRRHPTRRTAELCFAFAFWFVPLGAALWRGRKRTDVQARFDGTHPHETSERLKQKQILVRDRYEQARSALYSVEDEAQSSDTTRFAEAALERYVNLSLLAAEDADHSAADPGFDDPRLTKLQSLAGRSGDDLDCAARCIARRNRRVLSQHLRRARAGLIQACEVLRSTRDGFSPRCPEFLIRFYDMTLELAATLDDSETHSAIAHIARTERTVDDTTVASAGAAANVTSSRGFAPHLLDSRPHRHAPLGSAN